MILQNKNLRAGIVAFMTLLSTTSLITSCQKDAQVAPTAKDTPVASNSMSLVNSTSSLAAVGGTWSAPVAINSKSNFTISGLTINCNNAGAIGIQLQGCSNVHITNCKILNSGSYGIRLWMCTNVTIDNCLITNVMSGVYAQKSTGVKVLNNQFLNMNGPFPAGNFVQFDNITGHGNQINYNKCENVAGVAKHPQDGISLYQSYGMVGDSITVFGNWIRGGQITNDSGGACGIGLGDSGGAYQVVRGNILVNPGYVGIQPQGGSATCSSIKVDHNQIYSKQTSMSLVSMTAGHIASNVYMGYNYVNWTSHYGTQYVQWYSSTVPQGASTNVVSSSVTASILPSTIITMY